MTYILGLITGLVLGFLLKRSDICFTGLIRDIYLQRQKHNIILFLAIVSTEGFIYHALGHIGAIRIPAYLPPFSLLAVAIGSFIFGMGAVLASGCLSGSLVKCGDGKVSGLIAILSFMLTGYLVSAGPLVNLSKLIRKPGVVQDAIPGRLSLMPLILFAIIAAITYILLYRYYKTHKLSIDFPGRYKGFMHTLLERIWPLETATIAIGAWLGIAFLSSDVTGRHSGVSLATPTLSWIYAVTKPDEIVGGCNPYDQVIGWGSMLVIGLIAGSFTAAKLSGEFTLIIPRKKEALRAAIGGALMGIGAMWGQGCLLTNAYVGTDTWSLKSIYAAVFLIAGIWTATRLFILGIKRN